MDTYPLLALQEAENLRTDVTVLNYSMLNLTWYMQTMCPWAEFHSPYLRKGLILYWFSNGIYTFLNSFLMRLHTRLAVNGRSVLFGAFPGTLRTVFLTRVQGHYEHFVATPPVDKFNIKSIMQISRSIDPDQMKGSFISSYEVSPVRLHYDYANFVDFSIVLPWMDLASEVFRIGDTARYAHIKERNVTYCTVPGNTQPLKKLELYAKQVSAFQK